STPVRRRLLQTPMLVAFQLLQWNPSALEERSGLRRMHGYGDLRHPGLVVERADPHAEKTDASCERHALQALAGGTADGLRVLRRAGDRAVARHRLEIVEAQLEPDRLADVTLAAQIVAHAFAQVGEDARERLSVTFDIQVAVERQLAT